MGLKSCTGCIGRCSGALSRSARDRSGSPPRRDAARFTSPSRAFSSVGRAPPRQGGGHWFEPSNAHSPTQARRLVIGTYAAVAGGVRRLAGDRAGGDRALRAAALVVAGAGGRAGPALRDLLGRRCGCRGTGSSRRSSVLAPRCRLGALPAGTARGRGEALRAGWPVALVALLAASLPFVVEGHFGILGTSFNPDMSQHLLAADRLAHGESSQLLHQGYPLGPHAIVVALNKGLGIGLVQGFGGLTVAVAVLAPLTALAAFANLRPIPPHGRRPGRRPRLRGRLLLRPGRLQGDDAGPLRPRLRPLPARVPPAPGATYRSASSRPP